MELILDLDSLLYKAAFSCEKRIRHVTKGREAIANFQYAKDLKAFLATREDADDLVVKEQHWADSEESALKLSDILLRQIKDAVPHDEFIMFVGGNNNFRFDIFPEYKANRAKAAKPVHLAAITNHVKALGAITPEGYEADDAVTIRAWGHIRENTEFVVAAIDKDLNQIPGWRFNYGTFDKPYEITPYEADLSFYSQLLTGDTSDNIPGIKGVGPVGAAKLLAECDDEREMYTVCKETWDDEEAMTISAKLLYMLRSDDDEWKSPL